MDINDNLVYFSSYEIPPIEFYAPSVSITFACKDDGYNTISGTSMAALHV